jgi:hypothetical protein
MIIFGKCLLNWNQALIRRPITIPPFDITKVLLMIFIFTKMGYMV